MRYCLPVVLLLAVSLRMSFLRAAPAPDPVAVLDVGPPMHGETLEEHVKGRMEAFTSRYLGIFTPVSREPEVRNLPPITSLKDPRPWLIKNMEVTPIPKTSRLRLSFRAGSREEKKAILNAVLRVWVRRSRETQRMDEDYVRKEEERLARLTKDGKPTGKLQTKITRCRAMIAAYKQIDAIQWAK